MGSAGLLADVAAEVLADVVAGAGRWIATGIRQSARKSGEAIRIAQWFDTYTLVDDVPELDDGAAVADTLRTDDVQAILHELLAVRLSEAPESTATKLSNAFVACFASAGHETHEAAALFDYFDREICGLVLRLTTEDSALVGRIRRDAFLTRITATLNAIERHTAALADRDERQTDAEFLARYRRHVADFHGKLQPPDFQRRRRVPIADLYVAPTISGRALGLAEATGIGELDDIIERTVLLGDPGGGKTTASHVLMHRHGVDAEKKVPFLVTLREFAADDPPERSVVAHIRHKLETFYQCAPPAGTLERLLLSGGALVIFDGLDELVDTGRRADVTAIVERFCYEYPLTRVLVTSRRIGYEQARLDESQFTEYQLADFGDEEVTAYVRKWFAQEDELTCDDAARWAEDFLTESAAVADLRANPLMLALMCILYRGEGSIPRNRPDVYEQCATLFFRRWDASRRIHIDLRARNLVEPALRHLAYWLFTRESSEPAVSERELIAETTRYFATRGFEDTHEAETAAREFIGFCRGRAWVFSDAGTTAHGESLYTFTHRTFMEYFAAVQLAAQCDTPEKLARKLAPHIAREEWEVVAELAVQVKDRTAERGAERIFRTLVSERRRRSDNGRQNILSFVAKCLAFTSPSAELVRDVTRQILDFTWRRADLDGKEMAPLTWLIINGADYVNVILREFSSSIDTRLEVADDLEDRAYALRLALYSHFLPSLGSPTNIIKHNEKWGEFCGNNRTKYQHQILDLAPYEKFAAMEGLESGHTNLKELLSWHGPSLEILFDQDIEKIRGIGVTRVFRALAGVLITCTGSSTAEQTPRDFALSQLTYLNAWLDQNPHPPWTTSRQVKLFSSFRIANKLQASNHEALTAEQRTAAMVLSCMHAETNAITTREIAALKTYPHLRDLIPYLERRHGKIPIEPLPALKVPRRYSRLFSDWAEGRVDFLGPSPPT